VALHIAPDIVLLRAGTGSQPHTIRASIKAIFPSIMTEDPDMGATNTPRDWVEPLPLEEETRRMRHTDVSQDM
jgi:hypothetical protein